MEAVDRDRVTAMGQPAPWQRVLRRIAPRPWRLAGSRMLAEATSLSVRRGLARIGRSKGPVIVGPWLGEVGFELLYWIPFLAWACATYRIDRDRVVAISRGGAGPWYRGVAGSYRDVYDYLAPEDFKSRNERRLREAGEQKQVRIAQLDREIVGEVERELGIQGATLLHPATMYGLFNSYWWGHTSPTWIHRHTRFQLLPADPTVRETAALPRRYIAAKFYFNECFPSTEQNRQAVAEIVRRLDDRAPVVELSTGLTLDDHGEFGIDPMVRDVRHLMQPDNNLAVQSAVVAGAEAFVGTYGGFAYLAPFYGVPSLGVYSRADGFSQSHLTMALSALDHFPGGRLEAHHVADPTLADRIARLPVGPSGPLVPSPDDDIS